MANPHPSTKGAAVPAGVQGAGCSDGPAVAGRDWPGARDDPPPRQAARLRCRVPPDRVKQAGVDARKRPRTTTADAEELKARRQEVKELRRANEMAVPPVNQRLVALEVGDPPLVGPGGRRPLSVDPVLVAGRGGVPPGGAGLVLAAAAAFDPDDAHQPGDLVAVTHNFWAP